MRVLFDPFEFHYHLGNCNVIISITWLLITNYPAPRFLMGAEVDVKADVPHTNTPGVLAFREGPITLRVKFKTPILIQEIDLSPNNFKLQTYIFS
jgi:hypothetical protein